MNQKSANILIAVYSLAKKKISAVIVQRHRERILATVGGLKFTLCTDTCQPVQVEYLIKIPFTTKHWESNGLQKLNFPI